jgi:hypothetical protein
MNIKRFYTTTYSTDELGLELNETATFEGLIIQMTSGSDVYQYIGVYDSVVRERVFEKLADLLDTSYENVYKLWLN